MCFLRALLMICAVFSVTLVFGPPDAFAELTSEDLIIERFPVAVGNSWDYRRTFYTAVHDTLSGAVVQEILHIDSLHAEFLDIETVNEWECYKYSSKLFDGLYTYSDTVWYAHPESSFFEIGYTPPTHAGPPWKISAEPILKFGGRSLHGIQDLKLYLYMISTSGLAGAISDVILWDPPKKLFVFPLTVGMEWTSITDPWKEERKVVSEEFVQVPAGDFSTLKIDMIPEVENLLLYQWLSEYGIIKDSAHFASILVTDMNGKVIGFMEGYDKYELLKLGTTEVREEDSGQLKTPCFSLTQNYPNPFNPSTFIRFSLSVDHSIETSLIVYNILGEKVRTIVDEQKGAGNYEVPWDGKDNLGKEVASGIYFYQLKVGEFAECKSMLFLK